MGKKKPKKIILSKDAMKVIEAHQQKIQSQSDYIAKLTGEATDYKSQAGKLANEQLVLQKELVELREKVKEQNDQLLDAVQELSKYKLDNDTLVGNERTLKQEISRLRRRLRLHTSDLVFRHNQMDALGGVWKGEAIRMNKELTLLRAELVGAEEMPWQLEKAVDEVQDAINAGADSKSINITELYYQHGGDSLGKVTLFQFVAYCDMRGLKIDPKIVESITTEESIKETISAIAGEAVKDMTDAEDKKFFGKIEELKLRFSKDRTGWRVMDPGVTMKVWSLIRQAAERKAAL